MTRARTGLVASVLALAAGCHEQAADGGGTDAPAAGDARPDAGATTLRDRQRQLAIDLRGAPNFMVGLGNDNTGPYDHAIPIDLHYAYLVGYGDSGGWPTWNDDGNYPRYFAETARAHGVTPMFTYYQLAYELESSNGAILADATRMHQYLSDIRLLFQKIAEQGSAAAVNFEPDFYGYLMHLDADGTPPEAVPARTQFDDIPECAGLPETAAGFARCMVAIARAGAPLARVGFHASMWGAWFDVLDPDADVEASGRAVADFLLRLGAEDTDFVSVETLDRDAGFWETSGGGETCSLTGGSRGAVYWDATDTALPNFAQHLRWVRAVAERLQRPALEWQTPLGVPSTTCGGADEHWRDNRVDYFFAHVPQLIDAGIAGMTFGTGAGGQTSVATDGDQFKTRAIAYEASPVAL